MRRCQVIFWTNADLLLLDPKIQSSKISVQFASRHKIAFHKIHLKILPTSEILGFLFRLNYDRRISNAILTFQPRACVQFKYKDGISRYVNCHYKVQISWGCLICLIMWTGFLYWSDGVVMFRRHPGPWFHIKMSFYQYRKPHCGDKTILRPSYPHNGISYPGKTASLYWIVALISPVTCETGDKLARYKMCFAEKWMTKIQ